VILLALAESMPSLAHGQDAPQALSGDVDEEVVVIGRRTFNALIREGAALTEDFYGRLNVVLDDPDFEIACRTQAPTGSRIRARVCQTRFQRRYEGIQASSILQNITPDQQGNLRIENWTGVLTPTEAEALSRAADFEAAILDAVNTDPILNQQFNRLIEIRATIETYGNTDEGRQEREDAEDGSQ